MHASGDQAKGGEVRCEGGVIPYDLPRDVHEQESPSPKYERKNDLMALQLRPSRYRSGTTIPPLSLPYSHCLPKGRPSGHGAGFARAPRGQSSVRGHDGMAFREAMGMQDRQQTRAAGTPPKRKTGWWSRPSSSFDFPVGMRTGFGHVDDPHWTQKKDKLPQPDSTGRSAQTDQSKSLRRLPLLEPE